MDDGTTAFTTQLCTRAGMTMEDASVKALTIDRLDLAAREDAICQLDTPAGQIRALLQAAKTLVMG